MSSLFSGARATPMRHFGFLDDADLDRLFHVRPETFSRDAARDFVSVALGGTLYSPATRATLTEDIVRCHKLGVIRVCPEFG